MYKVIKNEGSYSTITLVNTETKASVMIGKLGIEIITILTDAGHRLESHEAWDLVVAPDTATKLYNLTMTMRKPIRYQSKKHEQASTKIDMNEPDAFDVLFGRAKYED